MNDEAFETDVLVIGGGPAGLAAAIAVKQSGFSASVVDCIKPPVDNVCGEGLMPDGLHALAELGVIPHAGDAYPFHGIRFTNDGDSVDAHFPRGFGLGLRRSRLHQALIDRAEDVGVIMQWGVRISRTSENEITVNDRTIRAKWLIGADGQSSMLRQWAGLDSARPGRLRYRYRRHFRVAPWSDFAEIHWGYSGQLYVTPVGANEVCVVLLTSHPGIRLDRALVEFPKVAARLKKDRVLALERGAVSLTRRFSSVQRGNIALVGDASGSLDSIGGEGLSLAFQHAVALADALKRGNLRDYEAKHRSIARLPRFMTELMLTMDTHHRLRQKVFRAFLEEPSLFSRMLSMQTGERSPLRFGVQDTLSLSWRLLHA